jgi:hypothetical protein
MDRDHELDDGKARLLATIERNRSLTTSIATASAEPSKAFAMELWRGLLAVNGAGLAASATILSVSGFPSLYLKLAAVFFFLGLSSSIFSWAIGLGFPYWASQFAVSGQAISTRLSLWLGRLNEAVSASDTRECILQLKQINHEQDFLITL